MNVFKIFFTRFPYSLEIESKSDLSITFGEFVEVL